MKHAKALYTCVGLMAAAAITGFVDYSNASKAGLLTGLYEEETTLVKPPPVKEINTEDFSRAAFDYEQEDIMADETLNSSSPKKKPAPPPPPPPPAPALAPEPPEMQVPKVPAAPVITEVPLQAPSIEAPPVPAVPEIDTIIPDAPDAPEAAAVKEVSYKDFSRAPLKPRKAITKNKKNP